MLKKYEIEYLAFPRKEKRVFTHQTDDPIEAEDFLMHLLADRAKILVIRHEGTDLKAGQFDRMLKVAADRIASELLKESLDLDSVQVRDRFGFSA